MGKIKCVQVERRIYEDDDIAILPHAYIVAVDEGEHFKVTQRFEIDLDEVTDEKLNEVVRQALSWTSNSRTRLERAKQIAEKLRVPLEIK
ncbi:MAG: hypothetical protein QW088_07490 [Desulfurococcaceae archaeon]